MCVCVWPLLRRFTNTKQLPKCSNLFIHWNSLLNLPQSKILYHTQYKVPHKFKILSRPANRANHLISNSHIYFVDVFFQVETRLQNPTKYHVLQSQKRQLREFLEECDTGVVPVKQHLLCPPKAELKPRSAPETTISTTSNAASTSKSEVVNTSSCPSAAPVSPRSPKPKSSVPKNDAKRGARFRKKQVGSSSFFCLGGIGT